ncbi:MAG TPA: SAM-dependent methyltransferase [Puia sp.]|nr:SAM-dependent methyltransferase [Puia sp.]
MPVPDIIVDTIRRQGPVSFRDFMEMALYYPEQGYYASCCERVGAGGDFYTSAYLTRLFGEMIARQLEEMWRILDCQPFTIVEYGAGTGLLCRDILSRLRENAELFRSLQYVIIEKSESMRHRERSLLAAEGLLDKLRWESSIEAVSPVNGCILSNELVDNFAVHQVVMEDELMEVFVGYENGFIEMLRPASSGIRDYLRELQVILTRGFRAEINLEATRWIRDVSAALGRGFVITIDYGNSSSGLYNRPEGTLTCYRRHRVSHSPYEYVGEQDITSHVNFSALEHWGRQGGLEYCGFTSQTRFLQGLGLNRRLQQIELGGFGGGARFDGFRSDGFRSDGLRSGGDPSAAGSNGDGPYNAAEHQMAFRQLYTLLVDMGSKFKVLIQRKGIGRQYLSGLQFAQVLA